MIHHGDCLERLRALPADSLDSMVTDPPAGIAFMGKDWDKDKGGRDGWIAWMTEVMTEACRVLKPGAHALVWAIPRTSHWTMTALENAGFEIRDVVTHLFGSGFPKSMDVSKAIDAHIVHGKSNSRGISKALREREIIGRKVYANGSSPEGNGDSGAAPGYTLEALRTLLASGVTKNSEGKDIANLIATREASASVARAITKPTTPDAEKWQGFGTALKPACEFWILCRKPLGEKTVAANVLRHGTGALNIDASRIACDAVAADLARGRKRADINDPQSGYKTAGRTDYVASQGRFPANLVLSHSDGCDDTCEPDCAVRMLDEQSGPNCGAAAPVRKKATPASTNVDNYKPHSAVGDDGKSFRGDTGGASRFFYCAKASRSDRQRKATDGK